MSLIIDDYCELLTLYKIILEAKFNINPVNEFISGSPLVAELCKKIVAELSDMDEKRSSGSKAKWEDWLLIKNHMFNSAEHNKLRKKVLLEEGYDDVQINTIIEKEKIISAWESAIINAKKDSKFMDASITEKRCIAQYYLSPFICSDDELTAFIEEVTQ